MKKLMIVGCGPKAVAIAVKAHVLKSLGWDVPQIMIIDKYGPGANWDGTNGYTDGDTVLGTTPLEDVGFPYASPIDPSVDKAMLEFSYMAYMVSRGDYAEWVDRAMTAPTHVMLSTYYKWLMQKIDAPVITGTVTDISLEGDSWSVSYEVEGNTQQVSADGLVLTGPGEPFEFPRVNVSPEQEQRIFNGRDIWPSIKDFKDMKDAKIAVIGAGETSAGIVTALLSRVDESSQIEVISKHPILFTRNENWMEVMYFSTAKGWSELSKQAKMEIIRHADRGTFSVAAKALIDSAYNIDLQLGAAERIVGVGDKVGIVLTKNNQEETVEYDYVIEATGFNQFSFIKLFSEPSFMSAPHLLADNIDADMSVIGLSPKLHLPNLAAMAQGPGFPNLSCLGLLADRILTPYIGRAS